MRHLITLVLDLMAADDVVQAVLVEKVHGDIGAKLDTYTTLAGRGPWQYLWIRPQQVAHDSCKHNFVLFVNSIFINPVRLGNNNNRTTAINKSSTTQCHVVLHDAKGVIYKSYRCHVVSCDVMGVVIY